MKEFQEKAKDYLAAGVPRVWVIDPEAILIKIFLTVVLVKFIRIIH
jgi:Uma2 family endonuclease